MTNKKLSPKEVWLNQRGGRELKDVLIDENGKEYVWIGGNGGWMKKVYLPESYPHPIA